MSTRSTTSMMPLKGVAALMTAGSIYYSGAWLCGKIDSSELPSQLFRDLMIAESSSSSKKEPSPTAPASRTELILYKNYILGLLVVPTLTLLTSLWDGTPSAVLLGAVSSGLSNGFYSLHLTFTTAKGAFRTNMREAAAASHGLVAAVCFWQAYVARSSLKKE